MKFVPCSVDYANSVFVNVSLTTLRRAVMSFENERFLSL